MLSIAETLQDRRSVAVVLIDVQNDFCSARGGSAKKIENEKIKLEFGRNLVRFVGGARASDVKMIHVKTNHSEWRDNPVWLSRNKSAPEVCRIGSWGAEWWEEFPEFHPKNNEYVVTKHRYSAFVSTDLDMVLRCTGVKTIVLGGVATNTCVESTARDAFVLGYQVILLSDCTSANNPESHEAGLKAIGGGFGRVATSTQVLTVWSEKIAPRQA